jgi:hypothetical protein
MYWQRLVAALFLFDLLGGCMYMRHNLDRGKDGTYANYPTTVEREYERRRTRRRHALIAAPIEILAGAAIVWLAFNAKSQPSDAETVPGALEDAGKEILGRLVLAAIGGGAVIGGVGDGVLGLVDPLLGSPIVRDGKLVPADEIDALPPLRGPRFGLHATNVLSTDGIGADFGFGLAHWLSPTVRLRHAITGELTLPWGSSDRRFITSGEVLLERAIGGRTGAGLFPRRAIGIYAAGGWAAIEDRSDAIVGRAGLSFTAGTGFSYRLGTTYQRGDRLPSVDLSIRAELRVD